MKGEWMSYDEMCKAENVTVIPYEPPKEKEHYVSPKHYSPFGRNGNEGNYKKKKYIYEDQGNR